jgi:hypothetical protein
MRQHHRVIATYTIRVAGATACATSCVLPAVGSPVPMSRNWRTPRSAARQRTARIKKARFARTSVMIPGLAAIACSAASRSAAKLSLPPSQ